MTDNEIIKALECCKAYTCKQCSYFGKCNEIKHDALDLITRQKAEIERLQQTYPHNRYPVCVKVRNGEIYTHTLDDYDWLIGDISAEAVKEFAERVKEEAYRTEFGTPVVDVEDIDIIAKKWG